MEFEFDSLSLKTPTPKDKNKQTKKPEKTLVKVTRNQDFLR